MTSNRKHINVLKTTYLGGPNIWTYRPVIETVLDLGILEDFPSNTLDGLTDRLIAWLPGLAQHRCGVGEVGGFLERLREGTWAGHILEHIVLELQTLAGMKTGFGQTRSTHQLGVYKMAFRTRHEQVGRLALQLGKELLEAAINNEAFELAPRLETLRDDVDRLCLGPSTNHIVEAAVDRGIPFIRLSEGNLVQLGYGAAQRRIWTAETDRTSAIAEGIASDKDMTKSLLKSAGVPIPEGSLVRSADEAWEEAQDIGLPVVLKPYDGNHGRGVSLNLMTEAEIRAAYDLAVLRGGNKSVIVEKYIAGDEHRILVVGRQVVAVGKGETLWITGDGVSTVQGLIDSQINTDPRRGTTEEFPLNVIDLQGGMPEVILELQRQNLTAQSVPEKDKKVLIQHNGNVAFDVTDRIHPEIAEIAALAARVIGLDIAGIDMVAEDISLPLSRQQAAIIEVNASPGLLAHIKPCNGPGRNVGKAIIDELFAQDETGRIEVVGVTGSLHTTKISRLIATMLQLRGTETGLANAQGIFLNRRSISTQPAFKLDAGQRLLINRNVRAAVYESTPRSILEHGLPYDRCQVGVVTDSAGFDALSDHYITELDQMYKINRTQVDVVLANGFAVLNADDEVVTSLSELCDGDVILYARDETNPALQEHLAAGKRIAFVRENRVMLRDQSQQLSVDVPPQHSDLSYVLPAIAAVWALDLSIDHMQAGLQVAE